MIGCTIEICTNVGSLTAPSLSVTTNSKRYVPGAMPASTTTLGSLAVETRWFKTNATMTAYPAETSVQL